MERKQYSDAERLKWIFKTLHLYGGIGLATRLQMRACEEPGVFDVDLAITREEEEHRKEYTDTERLKWVLETLYRSGVSGLADKLGATHVDAVAPRDIDRHITAERRD